MKLQPPPVSMSAASQLQLVEQQDQMHDRFPHCSLPPDPQPGTLHPDLLLKVPQARSDLCDTLRISCQEHKISQDCTGQEHLHEMQYFEAEVPLAEKPHPVGVQEAPNERFCAAEIPAEQAACCNLAGARLQTGSILVDLVREGLRRKPQKPKSTDLLTMPQPQLELLAIPEPLPQPVPRQPVAQVKQFSDSTKALLKLFAPKRRR